MPLLSLFLLPPSPTPSIFFLAFLNQFHFLLFFVLLIPSHVPFFSSSFNPLVWTSQSVPLVFPSPPPPLPPLFMLSFPSVSSFALLNHFPIFFFLLALLRLLLSSPSPYQSGLVLVSSPLSIPSFPLFCTFSSLVLNHLLPISIVFLTVQNSLLSVVLWSRIRECLQKPYKPSLPVLTREYLS